MTWPVRHPRLRAALVSALLVCALAARQAPSGPAFPGREWERVADPASAGFCTDRLDAVTARAKTLATTGMVAIAGGRLLWDYGDIRTVTYLASVRKSVLAMMFGKYVEAGVIRLEATLADLGIDDVGGLTADEKQATVADLLAARSGVYHDAANAACTGCGATMGTPPPKGSVKHGEYFLYNNWDFNALGTIFEQQTKQNIYDAFERDFALPMEFQDFSRAAQRKATAPAASIHPAYHFYLSTRDMARLGLLMLRGGNWAGRQLVSRDWTRRIVTPVTHVADMHPDELKTGPFGYGYLWWVWDGAFARGPYAGAYTGQGAVGQYITVLPALDLVIAHKTAQGQRGPDGQSRAVSRTEYLSLVEGLIAAKCK
jgi:CubicO group peptidase (beta-lactamase class C family)